MATVAELCYWAEIQIQSRGQITAIFHNPKNKQIKYSRRKEPKDNVHATYSCIFSVINHKCTCPTIRLKPRH